MDRTVAPHGEAIGRLVVQTREGQQVIDMPVGIEAAYDVGPLARCADRSGAAALAVRQAFDTDDVDAGCLSFQSCMQACALSRFPLFRRGDRFAFTATGDANEQCRHEILLS
jgi:hypothetical protein